MQTQRGKAVAKRAVRLKHGCLGATPNKELKYPFLFMDILNATRNVPTLSWIDIMWRAMFPMLRQAKEDAVADYVFEQ